MLDHLCDKITLTQTIKKKKTEDLKGVCFQWFDLFKLLFF